MPCFESIWACSPTKSRIADRNKAAAAAEQRARQSLLPTCSLPKTTHKRTNPELLDAIKQIQYADCQKDTKVKALKRLIKICSSIAREPSGSKWQRLPAKKIEEMNQCEGFLEALVACGWSPDESDESGDTWSLAVKDILRQGMCQKQFESALRFL